MNPHSRYLMGHVWWRFWWAGSSYLAPGLHFWAGYRFGNLRIWGTDFVLQLAILLVTLPGVWLAGGNGASVKWGFALLLASQPFWLMATWRARHFGAFAVATLFTGLWIRAVLNSF